MACPDNSPFPTDALAAARLYLRAGLAPVPLPYGSKRPAGAGWKALRLRADDLEGYFPPGLPQNIAVLNGRPSGDTVDVDLDAPEARAAAPFLLPATGWVFGRPSSLRAHWVYRADPPLESAQEKYADLDGTCLAELRGTGGLTVFPPSTHEGTGERIAWDSFDRPAVPALADLRQAVRDVAAAALLARHWPAAGSRQDAALALAGGLVRSGVALDRALRLAAAVARAARDEEEPKRVEAVRATYDRQARPDAPATTGWPRLEDLLGPDGPAVLRRARGWLGVEEAPAAKKPAGRTAPPVRVRRPPAYTPFPVEALPAPLDAFVTQAAAALGCDPALLALPVLAAAAGAIGTARLLRLKPGWEEPAVIWAAVVGDSGTLKSPACHKAVAPLYRRQARWLNAHQGRGQAPRRLVCSDTTVEKLAEILADNPRGVLLARDELAGWLGSFTRYRQRGSDLQHWLEAHQGRPWVIDRKTGERRTLTVERVAVSVTGGIQPGILARALTAEFLDAGLAARLLMAQPPRRPKRWTEAAVAPEVEEAYETVLDRLLALGSDLQNDVPRPRVLVLSAEAQAAWVAFYDAWALEQAAAEGELAAALGKLEAYAARFALVHHVVSHAADPEDRGPVGLASVRAGEVLAKWFAGEARRVYGLLSEEDSERDARRLLEFLEARGGQASVREVQNSNSRRYPDRESVLAALAPLVDAGLVRWWNVPAVGNGREVPGVEVCPPTDHSDTSDTSDTWGGQVSEVSEVGKECAMEP